MRYVIAASRQATVDSCRAVLGAREQLEFRLGSVPEAGEDCDAAILNFVLAHERYGGSPIVGLAQALINNRGDGAPRLILATPPMSIKTASDAATDADIESAYLNMLKSCMAVYVDVCGDPPEAKILIHVEGAGIDRPNLNLALRALSDLLEM
ncbi:hypothetical protein QLQ12_19055 [Actinoplanes sp. NEAU-A12]|uniref:Uncharacterized protein n=1 Tax=Actinoplanes sandaracinus TaxID=3045177 RepID=A0ABT6WLV7_9ACTN|nr:hypothetical protein [Actinoplanes sandaracinus]MDI6100712.1 hypothetical protein [Actinoplanes sandaracinus]